MPEAPSSSSDRSTSSPLAMPSVAPGAVLQLSCFTGIELDDAAAAARVFEPVPLAPGQILFQRGEPADAAYLLVSGQVEIEIHGPGQADHSVAKLDAESILGEVGLMLGDVRTATAVARTPAIVWRVSREAFDSSLQAGQPWAIRLLLCMAVDLARRVTATDEHLSSLISESVHKPSTPRADKMAELEQLRNHLFTQWSF